MYMGGFLRSVRWCVFLSRPLRRHSLPLSLRSKLWPPMLNVSSPPCWSPLFLSPQEAAQSVEVLAALQKRNEELAASKDGEAVADLQR